MKFELPIEKPRMPYSDSSFVKTMRWLEFLRNSYKDECISKIDWFSLMEWLIKFDLSLLRLWRLNLKVPYLIIIPFYFNPLKLGASYDYLYFTKNVCWLFHGILNYFILLLFFEMQQKVCFYFSLTSFFSINSYFVPIKVVAIVF